MKTCSREQCPRINRNTWPQHRSKGVGIVDVAILAHRALCMIQCMVRTERMTTRAKPLIVPRCPITIIKAHVIRTTKPLELRWVFRNDNILQDKAELRPHQGSMGFANLQEISFEMTVRAMMRHLTRILKMADWKLINKIEEKKRTIIWVFI